MNPADDIPTEQLVGKRVRFKDGPEHADCWHRKAELVAGVVLRPALTLSQKAELMAAEGLALPQLPADEPEVPRVWVKADPAPRFASGCELAVEKGCLLIAPA
jgi:hypothetical protein